MGPECDPLNYPYYLTCKYLQLLWKEEKYHGILKAVIKLDYNDKCSERLASLRDVVMTTTYRLVVCGVVDSCFSFVCRNQYVLTSSHSPWMTTHHNQDPPHPQRKSKENAIQMPGKGTKLMPRECKSPRARSLRRR